MYQVTPPFLFYRIILCLIKPLKEVVLCNMILHAFFGNLLRLQAKNKSSVLLLFINLARR